MDLHADTEPHTQASLGPLRSVFDNKMNEWKLLLWETVNLFLSWNFFQNPFNASEKKLAKHSSCGNSKT